MKTVKPDRARKVHILREDEDGTKCGYWNVSHHDHSGNLPVPEWEMCSECLKRHSAP